MAMSVRNIADEVCVLFAPDGPPVEDTGRDLVEAALNEGASTVVVPVSRLSEDFFRLRSGVAGEILQKAANYRLKMAVLGDVSAHVAVSDALRDFVIECNRGTSIFFVRDIAELEEKLAALKTDAGSA
jgi:hypothetical protein